MPATIEKTFAAGSSYDITSLSWTPEITTIDDLGANQIKAYWGQNAATLGTATVFKELSNWKTTYVASTKTISLSQANYTNGAGSAVALSTALNIASDSIKFTRTTSLTPLRTFREGAKLSASDLSIIHNQLFDSLEEEDANTAAEFTAERSYLTTNFYTKTEIDTQMQALNLFPDWASGVAYLVGDVVLHNSQIWYATINHTSSTAPSSTNSQWTVVAPDATLENITYIRKFPGIKGTPVSWNTIVPRTATALGLAVKHPEASDISGTYSGTIFTINDENDTKLFHVGAAKTFEFDTRANFNSPPYFADNVFMFQGISNKSLFLGTAPATAGISWLGGSIVGDNPRLVITRSDSTNAYLECRKDDGTSHFQIEQTGLLTMNNGFQTRGSDSRVYKNLWVGDEIALSALPSLSTTGINSVTLGGSDNHVFGNANIRLGSWSSPNFTEKITIDADSGNVGTVGSINADGNITTGATVNAGVVRLSQAGMQSSEYLGTNSNGDIITKTGPASVNNVKYAVTSNSGETFTTTYPNPIYLSRGTEDGTTATWQLAKSDNSYSASTAVATNINTRTTNTQATGTITPVSATGSAYASKTCQICDGSDSGKKCVTFTPASSDGGSGTAYNWNITGLSSKATIAAGIAAGIAAAKLAGNLRITAEVPSGEEYVTLENDRVGDGSNSIGSTGNATMTLTNSDTSVYTTIGMSGGIDYCGSSAGTGGSYPCQDFDALFMGTVSGFTGKVCNCNDSTNEANCLSECPDSATIPGSTPFNQNLLPGDFYFVDTRGRFINFKYTAAGDINDPIGMALTPDIMMVMPYRANFL